MKKLWKLSQNNGATYKNLVNEKDMVLATADNGWTKEHDMASVIEPKGAAIIPYPPPPSPKLRIGVRGSLLSLSLSIFSLFFHFLMFFFRFFFIFSVSPFFHFFSFFHFLHFFSFLPLPPLPSLALSKTTFFPTKIPI